MQHIRHTRLLANVCSRATGRVEENRIEYMPPQGQAPVAKAAISMTCDEIAAKLPTRRRSDDHPRELRGALRLDLREDSHVVKHA
jgi:hypothetical protein